MTASDYMQYCDVTYDGEKYRGVKFSALRPQNTDLSSITHYSQPDTPSCKKDNGYHQDTTYRFRYEPLQWRVLDVSGLVLCETAIDSQPFNNDYVYAYTAEYDACFAYVDADKTHDANEYEYTSLRAALLPKKIIKSLWITVQM